MRVRADHGRVELGGRGLVRGVWCTIWPGKNMGVIRGVRGVYWTWFGELEEAGSRGGMVRSYAMAWIDLGSFMHFIGLGKVLPYSVG